MLLNEFKFSSLKKFRDLAKRINTQYGIKLSETLSRREINASLLYLEEKIANLPDTANVGNSADAAMLYMIKEAWDALHEHTLNIEPVVDPVEQYQRQLFNDTISNLVAIAVNSFCFGASFEESVKDAMSAFNAGPMRYSVGDVEMALRGQLRQELISQYSNAVSSGLQESASMTMTVSADTVADMLELLRSNPAATSSDICIVDPEAAADITSDQAFSTYIEPAIRQQALFNSEEFSVTQKKMDESTIKALRNIIESQVAEAEIIATARSFASDVQEMIEKLGRLQNESLPPLTDAMKDEYGIAVANDFHTKSQVALQGALEALYAAKDEIDNSVIALATGQYTNDLASAEFNSDELSADPSAASGSEFDEIADEFGADPSSLDDDPLGRTKKESIQHVKAKILEMQEKLATLSKRK